MMAMQYRTKYSTGAIRAAAAEIKHILRRTKKLAEHLQSMRTKDWLQNYGYVSADYSQESSHKTEI